MPRAMEAMERLGVPKRIVGFVMPTGYSFNLDGSMIFLAVTSIFIVQAAGPSVGQHFGFAQQLSMMVAFMITSKGIAGVPRASILVLLATLTNLIPAPIATAGVAIVLGVDAIMDMGRSCVNLVGNALATLVIARWEGEFDEIERAFSAPRRRPNSTCAPVISPLPKLWKRTKPANCQVAAVAREENRVCAG